MGNPTTHIFRLTSCPQLSKIKQNISRKAYDFTQKWREMNIIVIWLYSLAGNVWFLTLFQIFWHLWASSVVKLFLPSIQAPVGPGLAESSLNPDLHWQASPTHSLFAPVHVVEEHSENNGRSCFSPNWHEGGHFPPPFLFRSDFLSNIFQINLEVKIDINRVIVLTLCQAHWVL